MKRTIKRKVNVGPPKPTNRAAKKEEAEKFINDCEQALIRLIDQESKRPNVTWPDLNDVFENKVIQLLKNPIYKDRKGHIVVASNNVRKALYKLINDAQQTKGAKADGSN